LIEGELFEITAEIGCPVNCKKYCPQEVIVGNYKGATTLTLENFKLLIEKIPKRNPINFSGVCEPFTNPRTVDMISYTHNAGHPIIVFSTLVGLTPVGADVISRVPFQEFVLHLPDANKNAHIPLTRDYFITLKIILSNVNNISFMNMREPFISNNAEKIARGEPCIVHKGRVICFRHEIPNLNMMPNGDVYFCCICRGLTGKVGSLYENTYQELVSKMKPISKCLQIDKNSICHKCGYAVPYWRYQLRKIKRCLYG
jgi:hypothetical protein